MSANLIALRRRVLESLSKRNSVTPSQVSPDRDLEEGEVVEEAISPLPHTPNIFPSSGQIHLTIPGKAN